MKVLFVKRHPDAVLPKKNNPTDSGFDLYSVEYRVLLPLHRALIDTGVDVHVGAGFEAQIRPRSGNAHKLGLTVLNSPGTVDGHYTGNLKVILINLSKEIIEIKKGDRIAQMAICPVLLDVECVWVDKMPETDRGGAGWGSSD